MLTLLATLLLSAAPLLPAGVSVRGTSNAVVDNGPAGAADQVSRVAVLVSNHSEYPHRLRVAGVQVVGPQVPANDRTLLATEASRTGADGSPSARSKKTDPVNVLPAESVLVTVNFEPYVFPGRGPWTALLSLSFDDGSPATVSLPITITQGGAK
jgi:hypothetical protein